MCLVIKQKYKWKSYMCAHTHLESNQCTVQTWCTEEGPPWSRSLAYRWWRRWHTVLRHRLDSALLNQRGVVVGAGGLHLACLGNQTLLGGSGSLLRQQLGARGGTGTGLDGGLHLWLNLWLHFGVHLRGHLWFFYLWGFGLLRLLGGSVWRALLLLIVLAFFSAHDQSQGAKNGQCAYEQYHSEHFFCQQASESVRLITPANVLFRIVVREIVNAGNMIVKWLPQLKSSKSVNALLLKFFKVHCWTNICITNLEWLK